MGSSLVPSRRKIRGEPSVRWVGLRDTDLEEKWSSAREIPQHVRDYERSRWRLVYDDQDDRLVSAEDAAWQHLDDNSWESSYYNGRRGSDGEEGQSIDASLLNIDSRVPVVQPEDSRPTIEWFALGGPAAVATWLNIERERRENFVSWIETKFKWADASIAHYENRLRPASLAAYEEALTGRRFETLRTGIRDDRKINGVTEELTQEELAAIQCVAAVDAAERTKRYLARTQAEVGVFIRHRQILARGLREARELSFVLTDQEYREYAKLAAARNEWDRSYSRADEATMRAKFTSLVCFSCGGIRCKIRRHPDYHWYSSCPDCEETLLLRVADVEPPELPTNQHKVMLGIKNRVRRALTVTEKHPLGIVPLGPTHLGETWWIPRINIGQYGTHHQ